MDKIGLASDHAGFELKEYIRTLLDNMNIPYIDYGTYSTESVNYAHFGHRLATAIEQKEIGKGIAVCGSGNGINMSLNRHKSVRSALCWNEEIARLARAHNDANVLALPGRFLAFDSAEKIINIFLNTDFEGGRHQSRIDTI
jgi:ribose 5-phosphate isomerase B